MGNPVQAAGRKPITSAETIEEAFNSSAAKDVKGFQRTTVAGPSYKESLDIERSAVSAAGLKKSASVAAHDMLEHGGIEIGVHLGEHLAKKLALNASFLKGAPPLGIVYTAMKLGLELIEHGHEGGELRNQALNRDAFTMTTMLIADTRLLPAGFAADMSKQLEPAAHVVTALRLSLEKNLGAEGYKGLVAIINQNVREGAEWALGYALKDRQSLQVLREKDPSFAQRFDNDIAFRVGVESAVWEGQHAPARFDQRAQLLQHGATTAHHLGVRP